MLTCVLLEIYASQNWNNREQLVTKLGYAPSFGASFRLITSSFVHGNVVHLLGNLLFLYVVGLSVENRWGKIGFLVLWLTGAIASAATFGVLHRGSEIYLIGASGAVAAVMGVFLVCFHSATIQCFYFILIKGGTFSVPAYVALPVWFTGQMFWMWFEAKHGSGVAYSAHVGGFAFGAVVALALKHSGLEKRLLFARVADGDELHQESDLGQAENLLRTGDVGRGRSARSRQPG
jgi:membrane associated rhomboid family serine protease